MRAAYRHANGLTLDQAADRCNEVANDADTRITGSRICDWEGWPQTGRRPSAFNVVVLAKSYGTQPRRLISPDEWEALNERERLILTELGRSHDGQRSPEGQLSRALEPSGAAPAAQHHPEAPSVAALTAEAAQESLAFATWAESSNVSASALDHLNYELGRIALNYVHAPMLPLFHDLTALRRHACELLRNGRQHPPRHGRCSFWPGRGVCCWRMPRRTWVTRPPRWRRFAPR